jgi:excinuclease UvrABC nuclease subunit
MKGVYYLTNTVNGKKYVGSSNNIYKRYLEHMSDLKANRHPNQRLQSDYNSGLTKFTYTICEMCEESELKDLENVWINKLKPQYNICIDSRSRKGLPSPMKGRLHNKYTIEILRRKNTGSNNAFYGKQHTEESKHKMSVKLSKDNHPQAKINTEIANSIKGDCLTGLKHRLIAEKYNVSLSVVKDISSGRTWN